MRTPERVVKQQDTTSKRGTLSGECPVDSNPGYLDRVPRAILAFSGFLFAGILGLVDYLTGPDLSFLLVASSP